MSKERRRGIRTEQLRMREMNIFVTGTDPDPITPLGFDRFGVSIAKGGTGNYTITILSAFGRDDIMGFASPVSVEGGTRIANVTRNSMQVLTYDMAGAPLDMDFMLRILGSEFNYDI